MIRLLAMIFIKDRNNQGDMHVRHAYGVLCGAFGVFLNLVLFGMKLMAGLISGSVAIIADAINNLSDAGSSVISMVGFKMAGQKPDPEHPYPNIFYSGITRVREHLALVILDSPELLHMILSLLD